jgi:hypothetical protein
MSTVSGQDGAIRCERRPLIHLSPAGPLFRKWTVLSHPLFLVEPGFALGWSSVETLLGPQTHPRGCSSLLGEEERQGPGGQKSTWCHKASTGGATWRMSLAMLFLSTGPLSQDRWEFWWDFLTRGPVGR